MTAMSQVGSLDTGTRLAVVRTRLAHDRTLMAWVRTAASLISFGFTIYKFFQYLDSSKSGAADHGILGPRGLAIGMIGVGLGALAIATIENRQSMKAMRDEFGTSVVGYSMATSVAGLVAIAGIFALVIVILAQ